MPSPNLLRKLDELDAEYQRLGTEMEQPEVLANHKRVTALAIRRKALESVVDEYRRWQRLGREATDLRAVISAGEDRELVDLARAELPGVEETAATVIDTVQRTLVMADEQTIGSVILEVRAGVGGDEASLWAGDLLEMYRRFAARRGWRVDDIEFAAGAMGGFKNATVSIAGEGAWAEIGYEGGTHQVKRVPATETQGRVHTSTATVAVLPEPEEVEVHVDPDEVKEIQTTAQGPGGQNVNKVTTAVQLIHLPTGIEVRMQDTRSLTQNRNRAWQLLRARLYERQRQEAHARRTEQRNAMIGSGDRAEKIRTYRYKENAVVDHRVEQSFNLAAVMAGELDEIVNALVQRDTEQRLAAL